MPKPAKNPPARAPAPRPRERTAPAARTQIELPDYLPARMLNEFVYCPRLFFYEWIEGVFAHNADTIEGELRHEKRETKTDPLPPPEPPTQLHSRSVMLSSEAHHLLAKMDLIEGNGGAVVPVDYKKGCRATLTTGRRPGPPIAYSYAPKP